MNPSEPSTIESDFYKSRHLGSVLALQQYVIVRPVLGLRRSIPVTPLIEKIYSLPDGLGAVAYSARLGTRKI